MSELGDYLREHGTGDDHILREEIGSLASHLFKAPLRIGAPYTDRKFLQMYYRAIRTAFECAADDRAQELPGHYERTLRKQAEAMEARANTVDEILPKENA